MLTSPAVGFSCTSLTLPVLGGDQALRPEVKSYQLAQIQQWMSENRFWAGELQTSSLLMACLSGIHMSLRLSKTCCCLSEVLQTWTICLCCLVRSKNDALSSRCCINHSKAHPLVAGAPDESAESFELQQSWKNAPCDPSFCSGQGSSLCMSLLVPWRVHESCPTYGLPVAHSTNSQCLALSANPS